MVAAVKMITGAVARMAADKNVGRAQARSKWASFEAHPAFWASFVVVGRGGSKVKDHACVV